MRLSRSLGAMLGRVRSEMSQALFEDWAPCWDMFGEKSEVKSQRVGRMGSKVSPALSKTGRHVGMYEVKDQSGSLEVWTPCWDGSTGCREPAGTGNQAR